MSNVYLRCLNPGWKHPKKAPSGVLKKRLDFGYKSMLAFREKGQRRESCLVVSCAVHNVNSTQTTKHTKQI